MAEAEGGAGEFLGEAGIHVGVVAVVGRDGALAQQMRQELAVGNVLDLGGHDGAGLLVEVVAAPVRVRLGQQVHLAVVLAQEQRLHRRQVRVLAHAGVAGSEAAIGDGQVVAGRGQHVAIRAAQAGSGCGVRTVDLAGVQPSGDIVDGGGGLAVVPGGTVDHRAGHADGGRAEVGVAGGNGNVDMGFAIRLHQVQVVVHELAPGIHHA